MTADPFPLAPGWQWARFGDVARVASDLVDPTLTPDAPHIAPNHLESWTGRILPYGTIRDDGMTSAKHRFRPGQILYSKIRPYLAKAALATFEGLCSADMYPIETSLEPTFLLRWMLTPSFTNEASRSQGRTVLPKINRDALAELRVPVAPLNEQRRIVAKLDAIFEQTRAAKARLERLPALLDKLKRSILAAAFRGDLTADWRAAHPNVEPASSLSERIRAERRARWEGALRAKSKDPARAKYDQATDIDTEDLPEIPSSWVWASLASLSWDSSYGTSSKCDYDGKGECVLRIPNVASGDIDLSDMKRSVVQLGIDREDLIGQGDFLIVRTNGSRDLIGRAACVLESDAAVGHYFASYLIRFRLVEPAIGRWLSLWWRSPFMRRWLEQRAASSAGQYNVSLSTLAVAPIPLPSVDELDPVVELVERNLTSIHSLSQRVDTVSQALGDTERAVLAKAFRGELVEQDPNDEPARTLVERLVIKNATKTTRSPQRGRVSSLRTTSQHAETSFCMTRIQDE